MNDAPCPDGSGYFLYHSIGLFPGKERKLADALAEFARIWATPDDSQWPRSLELRRKFIERWSRCIGAPAGTLTTAENVTTALCSLIGSLPNRYLSGRRVLIAADCFPSLHFLLAGMAERRAFVLETVPVRAGEFWVRDEDMIEHWGADVGVALLTLVASTSSHRCNLHSLVAHGRRMGSLIGLDITQGVGIVPYDVNTPEIDFTVSTTLKWLCGTSGAGILHVREPLLRECKPELRGWFSQENIFSWGLNAFEYARDARRFDHGTPSIAACVANLPALEWHATQDFDALVAHNQQLVGMIIDGARNLGLAIASPLSPHERGGSVMLQLPPRISSQALLDNLRKRAVHADCRGNLLRLSPGNMTTWQGVERLFEGLRG